MDTSRTRSLWRRSDRTTISRSRTIDVFHSGGRTAVSGGRSEREFFAPREIPTSSRARRRRRRRDIFGVGASSRLEPAGEGGRRRSARWAGATRTGGGGDEEDDLIQMDAASGAGRARIDRAFAHRYARERPREPGSKVDPGVGGAPGPAAVLRRGRRSGVPPSRDVLSGFRLALKQHSSFTKIWTSEGTGRAARRRFGRPRSSPRHGAQPRPRPARLVRRARVRQPEPRPGPAQQRAVEIADQKAWAMTGSANLPAVTDALFPRPVRFRQQWGQDWKHAGAYAWAAVPPPGFSALGMVLTASPDPPPLDAIRCVPESWTCEPAAPPKLVWENGGSGGGGRRACGSSTRSAARGSSSGDPPAARPTAPAATSSPKTSRRRREGGRRGGPRTRGERRKSKREGGGERESEPPRLGVAPRCSRASPPSSRARWRRRRRDSSARKPQSSSADRSASRGGMRSSSAGGGAATTRRRRRYNRRSSGDPTGAAAPPSARRRRLGVRSSHRSASSASGRPARSRRARGSFPRGATTPAAPRLESPPARNRRPAESSGAAETGAAARGEEGAGRESVRARGSRAALRTPPEGPRAASGPPATFSRAAPQRRHRGPSHGTPAPKRRAPEPAESSARSTPWARGR